MSFNYQCGALGIRLPLHSGFQTGINGGLVTVWTEGLYYSNSLQSPSHRPTLTFISSALNKTTRYLGSTPFNHLLTLISFQT